MKTDAQNVCDQIKLFDSIKDNYLSKGMKMCCLLGRNFQILKKELKLSNSKIDGMFEQTFGKNHGYSQKQRYFYMDLYDFLQTYGKIKNIALPYSDIKIRFKCLKERIKQAKDFDWK